MFNNKITKNTLKNSNISKIKEFFIKSNNKRYLEITFLCRGKWETFSLTLKEWLKEQWIKIYFDFFNYIDKNYNNDLYLIESKGVF